MKQNALDKLMVAKLFKNCTIPHSIHDASKLQKVRKMTLNPLLPRLQNSTTFEGSQVSLVSPSGGSSL